MFLEEHFGWKLQDKSLYIDTCIFCFLWSYCLFLTGTRSLSHFQLETVAILSLVHSEYVIRQSCPTVASGGNSLATEYKWIRISEYDFKWRLHIFHNKDDIQFLHNIIIILYQVSRHNVTFKIIIHINIRYVGTVVKFRKIDTVKINVRNCCYLKDIRYS